VYQDISSTRENRDRRNIRGTTKLQQTEGTFPEAEGETEHGNFDAKIHHDFISASRIFL
jgi:hypothetical protein